MLQLHKHRTAVLWCHKQDITSGRMRTVQGQCFDLKNSSFSWTFVTCLCTQIKGSMIVIVPSAFVREQMFSCSSTHRHMVFGFRSGDSADVESDTRWQSKSSLAFPSHRLHPKRWCNLFHAIISHSRQSLCLHPCGYSWISSDHWYHCCGYLQLLCGYLSFIRSFAACL